jgi:hypothetical protein
VNGSTPLCLHRQILMPLGRETAKYSTRYRVDDTLENTLAKLKRELDRKDLIILSAMEHPVGEDSAWTEIYGIVTGQDVEDMLATEARMQKKGLYMKV